MRSVLGYLAVTAALFLGGLGAWLYLRSDDLAAPPVWSGGEIRVGYSSEPPYSFRTPAGEILGIGPETAKAVLSLAGIGPTRWVLLDFGQAIGALLDGRIDMIANGLFITPQRSDKVAFSLPYCATRQGLLVRRGNPLALHAYEDAAKNTAVVVAVLDGSVEQLAMGRLGVAADRLFVVPDPAGGLAAVRAGRADCLALTVASVNWLAREAASEVETASPFYPQPGTATGRSAFAFRPGDVKLAARVNTALSRYLVGSQHQERLRQLGFYSESAVSGN